MFNLITANIQDENTQNIIKNINVEMERYNSNYTKLLAAISDPSYRPRFISITLTSMVYRLLTIGKCSDRNIIEIICENFNAEASNLLNLMEDIINNLHSDSDPSTRKKITNTFNILKEVEEMPLHATVLATNFIPSSLPNLRRNPYSKSTFVASAPKPSPRVDPPMPLLDKPEDAPQSSKTQGYRVLSCALFAGGIVGTGVAKLAETGAKKSVEECTKLGLTELAKSSAKKAALAGAASEVCLTATALGAVGIVSELNQGTSETTQSSNLK